MSLKFLKQYHIKKSITFSLLKTDDGFNVHVFLTHKSCYHVRVSVRFFLANNCELLCTPDNATFYPIRSHLVITNFAK